MIHIGYTNKDYNPDQVIDTTNSHLEFWYNISKQVLHFMCHCRLTIIFDPNVMLLAIWTKVGEILNAIITSDL